MAFVISTGIIAWLASQRGVYQEVPKKAKDVIEWKSQSDGMDKCFSFIVSDLPFSTSTLTSPHWTFADEKLIVRYQYSWISNSADLYVFFFLGS